MSTRDTKTIRYAKGVQRNDQWVIKNCPYCGSEHTHGDADLAEYIATRVPGCLGTNKPPLYVLTDTQPNGAPARKEDFTSENEESISTRLKRMNGPIFFFSDH